MRKNDRSTPSKTPFLSPQTLKILRIGLFIIYASSLRLLLDVQMAGPLCQAKAEQFGRMLEYPVAALAILTVATYITERAARSDT